MWFLRRTADQASPFLTTGESLEAIFLYGLLSMLQPWLVKDPESQRCSERRRNHSSHQMATWGEFQVLVFMLVLAFMEFQTNLWAHLTNSDTSDSKTIDYYYSMVAQSGLFGCLVTTALLATLTKRLSVGARLALHVAGPLGIVEVCLRYLQYKPISNIHSPMNPALPHSLQWLVEFILSSEAISLPRPRYLGLLYWLSMLVLLAPPTAAIVRYQNHSVVITRKWFHLVAVILFAPTTHFFPKLMAIGYAVALCGLLVLESIRRDAPFVDDIFHVLHDPAKDVAEGIMLSHLCLILGCAIPLWLGLAMEERMGTVMLLRYWGILCLGVGDAAAAVVGKTYGRFRWGRNGRTLEGSLAMWISMIATGGLVVDQWSLLLETTTIATILEAFTTQTDNLVLPLAGSSWIVLRMLGGSG